MRMSLESLVQTIHELPRDREYTYINPRNVGRIRIVEVQRPRGPIVVRRYAPTKGESFDRALNETISSNMLHRVANALSPELPLNIDRVLGASYNTRSVLESILAHCPQFLCAGRIVFKSTSRRQSFTKDTSTCCGGPQSHIPSGQRRKLQLTW